MASPSPRRLLKARGPSRPPSAVEGGRGGDPDALDSAKLLWKRMLRSPGSIGTVAPSSPWLARALVGVSLLEDADVVVEVGAGTGPLTGRIIEASSGAHFVALEPDRELRTALREAHPGIDVSSSTARSLPDVLARRGLSGADRVLSSVPWSLLPPVAMEREIDGIVQALAPGGRFVTLVYAHAQALPTTRRLETALRKRFSCLTHSGVVWRNVPPGRWLVAERPR